MKSIVISVVRLASRLTVAAGIAAAVGACDGGREGERCNPLLSHDECGSELSCQQPATCAESYCCPTPSTSSADGYCNGSACPPQDAGTTPAGGDDASRG